MIPFFVGYGVLMCILAFRGRRRVSGLLALVIGSLLLAALGIGYLQLTRHNADMRSAATVAGVLYYPYMLMVMLIAGWLVVLPRESKKRGRCGACGYSLDDLPDPIEHCPECGRRFRGGYHEARVMAEYQRRKWGYRAGDSATDQPPDAADDQHTDGQPEDQPPSKPTERPRVERPD